MEKNSETSHVPAKCEDTTWVKTLGVGVSSESPGRLHVGELCEVLCELWVRVDRVVV
jgi:hypothetical protein